MEPLSSAQASQMWLDRSRMLLDFFCQIHKSSSTALLKAILRMVCTGNSARRS